ncbi:MAG: DMT family transporter [Burkholderiaceae bacterium]|nr:DMT family transporter [Burkholderiaceae bacterium]
MSIVRGPAPGDGAPAWLPAAPFLFILIWATGYVVAKAAAPYAEPLSFLVVRYVGVIALMVVLALIARAPWPVRRIDVLHLAVAGIGIQAIYLGGVWVAVKHGMPAGVAALIVNLQPVLTALAGGATGERVRMRQWAGLVLGLAGVALVVSNKLGGAGMGWGPVLLAVLALLAITAGTLYQKRFMPTFDLRTGQVVQFAASVIVTLPFALAFESFRIEWNAPVVAAMLWSIVVLSGGGISLLFLMIRHGAATEVTSFMYLVPAVTALMAWAMFGERLGVVAVLGMVVTIVGVALVVRRPARR